MDHEILKRSICSTCNDVEKCVFYRHKTEPVFYCEEYNDYTPPKNHPVLKSEQEPEVIHEDISGLCKNCDQRNTCQISDKNKVIWHCEEYL